MKIERERYLENRKDNLFHPSWVILLGPQLMFFVEMHS